MSYKILMDNLQSSVYDVVISHENLETTVENLEKQVEDLEQQVEVLKYQIIELEEELKVETELADLYRKIV